MSRDILIVDDQPGIRLLLVDVLIEEGYMVITASNGQEAINILRERAFNLMIIDYKLPVLDGIEVIEKVTLWELKMPIIIMSGLVENLEDEIKKFPQVKKILAKPFNIFELRDIVNKYIPDSNIN